MLYLSLIHTAGKICLLFDAVENHHLIKLEDLLLYSTDFTDFRNSKLASYLRQYFIKYESATSMEVLWNTWYFFVTKQRLYFLEQNCVFIFWNKTASLFLEQNCAFIFWNKTASLFLKIE